MSIRTGHLLVLYANFRDFWMVGSWPLFALKQDNIIVKWAVKFDRSHGKCFDLNCNFKFYQLKFVARGSESQI